MINRIELIPKNVSWFFAFLSGLTLWIRVPYNLIKGVSFRECMEQEKYDLWNIGLKYRA